MTLMIVFHDMTLGGIQRKVVDIVKYLKKHHPQIKVIICLRNKKGIFLKQLPKNIIVVGPKFHTPKLDMVWFIFWMILQILKYRPTQILSFMDLGSIPTLVALKVLFWIKPKVIIGEDILTSKYVYTETRPLLRLKLIKKFYPNAQKVLVQTPIQKNDLKNIIKNSSLKIIDSPNWLPLDFPPQKNLSNPKYFADILFIGRLEDQKNLPRFIEIIKLVHKSYPQLKVNIVGDGTKKPNLQKLIRQKNLSSVISIIPPTSTPQNYYSNSKIFLLTSDYEGFPLTLMEAISSGCYPVVRNLPEIKQFFDHSSKQFIFHKNQEAVKIILSVLSKTSHSASYYQQKILCTQTQDITRYVNHIID